MRHLGWPLAAVALLILAMGCDRKVDGFSTRTKLQYVPDMADGPVGKAHRTYLDPPTGSVAMDAILYPESADESEQVLQNPFPASAQVVAEGKHLFETYCSVCHGQDARGEHALGVMYPRPPDITFPAYAERGDGYFFHVITFGSVIMPSYGHATSASERWKIIHYLRHLQNEATE